MKKIFVLIFCLIVISTLVSCRFPKNKQAKDDQHIGETFSGTYSVDFGVGTESYTFSEGNKVIVKVVTDEEVTNSYTYVVAIEDGKKVIKLTDDVTKEVLTYSFETRFMEKYSYSCSNENCAIHDPSPEGDDNGCPCGVGKLTPVTLKFEFLVINGQDYYDQNYRDWVNN